MMSMPGFFLPMDTEQEYVCCKRCHSQAFSSTETYLKSVLKHDVIQGLMNLIFPWKALEKLLIVSLLYGCMVNWEGEIGESYQPVQKG